MMIKRQNGVAGQYASRCLDVHCCGWIWMLYVDDGSVQQGREESDEKTGSLGIDLGQ